MTNACCLIVVVQVRQQHVTKMAFAYFDDMIDAFPADRTDQPFGICVLPWGARGGRPIANAHGSNSSEEDLTIGPIQITDEIAGSLVRAASFRELIGDPLRGRMRRDAKP
jgi:hypothetical protein